MLKSKRPIALVLLLAGSSAFAWNEMQKPGESGKMPDLTKACAKECPNSATTDDVFKCVERLERAHGEKTFRNRHRVCYNVHEKYEKISGSEEAGET